MTTAKGALRICNTPEVCEMLEQLSVDFVYGKLTSAGFQLTVPVASAQWVRTDSMPLDDAKALYALLKEKHVLVVFRDWL